MIDAHDTFITIHTKDGQNSQKIPFDQFLKKIVGAEVKVDDKIYLDVADLMTPGASSFEKSDYVSSVRKPDDLHKELEVTPTSDAKTPKVKVEPTQNPESDSGKGNNLKIASGTEASKPRGRGRPRKEKTEQEQNSEESPKALKGVLQKGSLLSKAESTVSVLSSPQPPNSAEDAQCPRRSRRTPARNSRFKDDFVDSSTLWSKGSSSSSSWNTQLMTLALAAERHETKPNKQAGPSRKRSAGPSDDVMSTEIEMASSTRDDCKQEPPEIKNDGESDQRNVPTDENEVEKSTNDNHLELSLDKSETSTQIIKKSLKEALTHAQNGVRDALSGMPLTIHSHKDDNICSRTYYVVMEPNLDASGEGFLVQKSGNGITFNTVNIEGKVPSENAILSSNSYPQERLFSCSYCDSIFPSSEIWRQHNKQIHGECMQPQLQIPDTLTREIHECPLCDERFPMAFMLENHIQKNQHVSVPTHTCNICRHCFPSAAEKEEHMQFSHPADSCSLCGKEFDNIVVLRHHLKNECPNGRPRNFTGDLTTESSPSPREGKEDDAGENVQIDFQGDASECAFESASVVIEKIPCDLCTSKFATYSGLWHHKLEAHRQFFPPGFRQKLEERLEKNETMLASTAAFEQKNVSKESGRSKYFVVMQPKWLTSKPQLHVSLEDKQFSFSVSNNCVNDGPRSEDANSREGAASRKRTRFVCNQCGDSFENASAYRTHRSQVHGECFEVVRYLGAFQCSQCSDTFPCQFMLDEHEKQHKWKKPLPCTLCGLSFHRIQERREHWKKSHPGIGCPNCGKMYASIKYLQKHISLDCRDHCPASKKSNDSLKRHHNGVDVGSVEKKVEKKILKCHLCPKICSSIHCWRRHMSENHENDGFSKLSNTCIICNKVIYGYKALERHLLQEHAEESGLPIEEENAIVSEALKRSKVDLVDYRKAGRDQANIFQDEENLYHCPECTKTHPDLKAMMIHIKTHVNMQLECSVCQKNFKNPTLLKQHVMRHRTKAVYTCNTCGKKFVTLQKLNKHDKVHHSKENFVCELCGMSFTLNDYLLKHKRCHTNKRPHSCSVCGKTFRTKPELRVHVLIHTQETPYVCEHCGRGFTQKGNWRIHLAQHTGHKPHKCNLCDLSFALPSHLKRHLSTHNQKVNYRCIWCDKECTQRKHMQMHVVRVHKEDFFHYEEQMKLETPIPIAPSQLKMYNRRLGKTGQVRKPYRTRAKKCNTTSQDIIKGLSMPKVENLDECIEDGAAMETIIEPSLVETVATDLNLSSQDIPQDGSLQILVSGDHQSYSKHGVTGELIGDDPSNVEIVMGDNNEINIIINNADHHGMNGDLAVPVHEALGEDGVAPTDVSTLSQFSEHASTQLQLQGSLQQAVNALVNSSKGMEGGEEGMALDIESLGTGGDTYAIVYPS